MSAECSASIMTRSMQSAYFEKKDKDAVSDTVLHQPEVVISNSS
jgi:hypothetical protein